ncbi:hypothetical protein [Persicobacter diffluens]|uniref:hypothetical protein n=1 Tax=Persicobacter diffluens TaxID=981 RepID=UPI0030C66015
MKGLVLVWCRVIRANSTGVLLLEMRAIEVLKRLIIFRYQAAISEGKNKKQ